MIFHDFPHQNPIGASLWSISKTRFAEARRAEPSLAETSLQDVFPEEVSPEDGCPEEVQVGAPMGVPMGEIG